MCSFVQFLPLLPGHWLQSSSAPLIIVVAYFIDWIDSMSLCKHGNVCVWLWYNRLGRWLGTIYVCIFPLVCVCVCGWRMVCTNLSKIIKLLKDFLCYLHSVRNQCNLSAPFLYSRSMFFGGKKVRIGYNSGVRCWKADRAEWVKPSCFYSEQSTSLHAGSAAECKWWQPKSLRK